MSNPSPELGHHTHSTDPAVQLLSLWQQGQAPPLEDFLASAGNLAPAHLVAVLLVDQRQRWRLGEQVSPEDYLRRFTDLQAQPEGILDLAYQEIVLREQEGSRADLDEYLRRFPGLTQQFKDQFEVHRGVLSGVFSEARPSQRSDGLMSGALLQDPLAAWPTLNGFQVLRRLGAGGMGIVYQAYDEKRNQIVALKTMKQANPLALYRFKQEFRVLADVLHPNLVALYELIATGPMWFFTMEYVEGDTFLAYICCAPPTTSETLTRTATATSWQPPASPPEPMAHAETGLDTQSAPFALDMRRLRASLRQLAEGITALHAMGKLHRDIKPSNVLVTAAGRVVLLDFGLATELDPATAVEANADNFGGTVAYMSPEQAAGRPLSPASDWYSLGVMLFEALTGRLPFRGPAGQVLREKQSRAAPLPSDLQPDVPTDLADLCVQLLHREPAQRPSGNEVLRRLAPGAIAPAAPAALCFVGRERQLDDLRAAFQVALQGRTVVVSVSGRSGYGKTALVQRFLEELGDGQQAVVLAGRCYERESVPYKLLDSLIDALSRYLSSWSATDLAGILPENAAALIRIFPVLRRVSALAAASPVSPTVDQQELRLQAFAALRQLLTRLGERVSLVLYIDDLQWGDLDSTALLTDLLRPPEPPKLCLVCSYRSEHEASNACLLAMRDLRHKTGAALEHREIEVGPMTADEARRLAEELLGAQDERAAVALQIASEAEGSPYFVRELVDHSRSGGRLSELGGRAMSGGMTLDDVLWQRVQGLPAGARQLLEVVAVSGRPLRQGDAYGAAELSLGDRAALAALRAGRLVRSTGPGAQDDVEPYHDRIREAVGTRLGDERLRTVHGRLAVTLEAAGQRDPETLAIHFQGAGQGEKAGVYYTQAAEQAGQALAFDRAANLYQQALTLQRLAPADERPLRTRLAESLANAGRAPDAARQYENLAEHASDLERIKLEQRASYQYCISGHLDPGRALLHTVLGRVGMTLPRSQWRALAMLLFNRLCLWWRGLEFRERTEAEVDPWELARIDVCWSVGAGLGTKSIIIAPAFQAKNLLLALQAGEPHRIARALAWEAAMAANEGQSAVPRISKLRDRASELAQRLDDAYLRGMVLLTTSIFDFHAGRWKHGTEVGYEAVQIFRRQCTGATWELGQANTFYLWCMSYQGLFAEMKLRSAQVLQEARAKGDLFTAANLCTYMEPLVHLAADDPQAAQQVATEALGEWSPEEFNIQHFTGLMSATYVDLYRGEGQAAHQRHLDQWPAMTKGLLLHAQICRVVIYELRGRAALGAAAGAADPQPYLRDAEWCIRKLEKEKLPFAIAWATLLRAGVAALRGDRSTSIRHLETAATSFDRLDMHLFAAVSRRRLGELRGGEDGKRLIDTANAWIAGQQIREPTRMAAAFAPWQLC